MNSLFAKILLWFWFALAITVVGSAFISALNVNENDSDERAPVARLVLSAERERAAVVINVEDDGRGIDAGKVLKNARAAGLVPSTQESLSDAEILELIARPGFSTSSGVSRLSGRGVGLDVVATKVRSLGGSVELTTSPGAGTTISVPSVVMGAGHVVAPLHGVPCVIIPCHTPSGDYGRADIRQEGAREGPEDAHLDGHDGSRAHGDHQRDPGWCE